MAPETFRFYLLRFVADIQCLYGSRLLNRYPNKAELQRIADKYDANGFVGCIGAVECCRLLCKNRPFEEKGQFHNPKDSKLSVMKVAYWCDSEF